MVGEEGKIREGAEQRGENNVFVLMTFKNDTNDILPFLYLLLLLVSFSSCRSTAL